MADIQQEPNLSSETIGNSARVASATVFNAIASGGSTIIVARELGTANFGLYVYLLFLLGLVSGISDLGVNARGMNVLVRAWAKCEMETASAEMRRLLRWNIARAAVVGTAAAIIFRSHPLVATLVSAAVILRAASPVFSLSLVARRNFRALALGSVGATLAQSVATSWVAFATHDAAWTIAVFLLGQLVDVAVALTLAPWSLLRRSASLGVRLPRLQPRTLIAFYVLGLCQLVIFGKSETLVLHHAGQAVALGLFAIATTLAARATLLTDALYGALVPSLGDASVRDQEGTDRAYSTAIRFSSLLVLMTAVVVGPAIVAIAPVILGASGGSVRVATAVVLGGSLLQTFVYPITAIASLEMQHRTIAVPAILGAAADVCIAVLLVPNHGLFGAALASLVGATIFGVGACAMVHLPPSATRTLRVQLVRVGMVIAALITTGELTAHAGTALAAVLMWSAVIVVYALCSIGDGVLIRDDLDRLTAAAPRIARRMSGVTRVLLIRWLLVSSRSSRAL